MVVIVNSEFERSSVKIDTVVLAKVVPNDSVYESFLEAGLNVARIGDAKEVIPTLKGTFDLIFIDAEKREYIDYMRLVEKKIQKGSLVVADNVVIFAEEVKDYLEYVRSSGKYRSKFIPVGADGLEVSTKL